MKPARALIAIYSSSALLLLMSCRAAQKDSPVVNSPSPDAVISATPPFKTREPERYRATRTITSVTANGKTYVVKFSLAKDGELRRFDNESEAKPSVSLNLPEGNFLLLPDEKIYASVQSVEMEGTANDEGTLPESLLYMEVAKSSYQKVGAESMSGRNTEKYRVIVNAARPENVSKCEMLVWVDVELGMPIKSEIRSPDGWSMTSELSGISLTVDNSLFQIPGDYKKVKAAELFRHLRHIE